eukprot:4960138-Prymnesium_polylepis.2
MHHSNGALDAAHRRNHAPSAFDAYIHRTLLASSAVSRPLSPTPAACITPIVQPAHCSAPTSFISALSHAVTSAAVPSERSFICRPCPSRATRPLRDARKACTAPLSTSSAAARSPSPPSPPVIV